MNFNGNNILHLFYLVSSILFIAGTRMLTIEKAAKKGNTALAVGMFIAIVSTLVFFKSGNLYLSNYHLILPAIVAGVVVGWLYSAKNTEIHLPRLVATLNTLAGLVLMLIAIVEFPNIDSYYVKNYGMGNSYVVPLVFGTIAATISFSAGLFALIKLQASDKDVRKPFVRFLNFALIFAIIGTSVYIFALGKDKMTDEVLPFFFLLLFFSLCFGCTLVVPAKKTDIPMLVAFLNMFTGVSLTMIGFFYSNLLLLVGGIPIASMSIILTIKMCIAVDRKFINLFLGDISGKKKKVVSDTKK